MDELLARIRAHARACGEGPIVDGGGFPPTTLAPARFHIFQSALWQLKLRAGAGSAWKESSTAVSMSAKRGRETLTAASRSGNVYGDASARSPRWPRRERTLRKDPREAGRASFLLLGSPAMAR
jgi:hypothetical protein